MLRSIAPMMLRPCAGILLVVVVLTFSTAQESADRDAFRQLYEELRTVMDKDLDEGLGLGFSEALFDALRQCNNRCPFCFIDQQPPGRRGSLYLKDDDYRLSFLYGSYLTLTKLRCSHCLP